MQLPFLRLSTMHPPCVTTSVGLSLQTLESGTLPAASTAGAAINEPSPNSTVAVPVMTMLVIFCIAPPAVVC
jgi:hypothetical protein